MHEGRVRCLAFCADGQRLATGGDDGKLVITDLASGNVLQSFQRNTGVFTVEFGADGETVAAGYHNGEHGEPVVRVWNLKDKDFVSLTGHSGRVDTVSLRSDGRLAVTTSMVDGSVRLWEIGGNLPRKIVLALGTVGEKLGTGSLSPDGRYVATGNSNGTIYLFRLPGPKENVGEWLAAKSSLPRGLSEEAWLKRVKGLYVGNVPDAIAERLRELNPGFAGSLTPAIEGGVVTRLEIGCDNVKDISPLRALPGLRTLTLGAGWGIGERTVADLSPLKDMKLTELHLLRLRVTDLSPLKDMKLSALRIAVTPVKDLSPLKEMKLTSLTIEFTAVTDLTPLKGMPLTYLSCACHAGAGSTPVSDLTPLKGMPLAYLNLARATQVSDLSAAEGNEADVPGVRRHEGD